MSSLAFEKLKYHPGKSLLGSKLIALTGPDISNYLHSQCTNTVTTMEDMSFQWNSILDIAGKIISSFILLKKNSDKFFILTENIEETLERIERYHISEDFEVEVKEKEIFLALNTALDGFKGSYFYEDNIICFDEPDVEMIDIDQLHILSGVPRINKEAAVGELINNTFFNELSIDYSKGCFPGQETVAKIHTRRGAAIKPVLLIANTDFDISCEKLTIGGKKAGMIKSFFTTLDKTFIYGAVVREYQVDRLKVQLDQGEAIVYYYPYIAISKEDRAQELYDHAIALFHAEKNNEAIKYFKKAIALNPSFEDAYESLGVLYGRLEEYQKAIELMEKLHEINSKCMMAYTNLSLFHMKLGNIEIAEKYKGDATLLNFELLGDEAEVKKQKEEAIALEEAELKRKEGMFKQVLEIDPEDAMANNGMGEIALKKQDFKEAESFFKLAIEHDKKYSVAYLGLAKSLYQQGKQEELVETLKLGIAMASKNGDLMPANEMQSMLSGL